MRYIPPFKYSFTEEDAAFIGEETRKLITSGAFLTNGRWNETFEAEFGAAHDAIHAVAVSSGTAALEILLRACNVAGRRVIAPSNTFGATLVAIERAGARPLLADCGEDFSLDPESVTALLDTHEDVAAAVVVHLGGAIAPSVPRLAALCRERGLDLVEDAAHASGAALNGRFAGAFGCGSAFSFFSTKVLTCGEGGMLLTADPQVAEYARLVRDHAKRADGGMDISGYNWRLTEMQALIGVVQTRRLDAIIDGRARAAAVYAKAVAGIEGVEAVAPTNGVRSNFYKLALRIPAAVRVPAKARLRAEFGVTMGGEIYAVPCHLQPAFAAYAAVPLPQTEQICAGHVCPPLYPDMTTDEATYAAGAVARVLEEEVARYAAEAE